MTFGPSYTALGLSCYTNVNRLPVAVLCKAWICIVVTSHIGVIRDHSKINKIPTARSGLRQMFRPPKTNDKCVFLRCFSFTHPLYQRCTSQTKTLRSWTATAWPSRASIISLTILKAHKSCRDDAGGGYEKKRWVWGYSYCCCDPVVDIDQWHWNQPWRCAQSVQCTGKNRCKSRGKQSTCYTADSCGSSHVILPGSARPMPGRKFRKFKIAIGRRWPIGKFVKCSNQCGSCEVHQQVSKWLLNVVEVPMTWH